MNHLGPILTSLLIPAAALGAEIHPIDLNLLPPSAVVLSAVPNSPSFANAPADISSLIAQNQALAAGVLQQGPAVLLEAGAHVMIIPQNLAAGSRVLVMSRAQAAGKPQLVALTETTAAQLHDELAKGVEGVAAAYGTLGYFWDGPSPHFAAAPVAAEADAAANPLTAEFSESLLTYHRLDGRKDGSGQAGVQFPPMQQAGDDAEPQLKGFIDRLSRFLGGQPEIDHHPAPTDPKGRDAFRARLAREAKQEIRENVMKEFMATVEEIESPNIKLFVKKALKEAQPEFWRAPSSSTGKYHPADEINYGGLLVHTIRNVIVGRMLSQYFNLTRRQSDIVAAALILHDIDKGGIPWKHDTKPGDAPDSGYVTDHGPVAAEWLKGFEQECGPDCDEIIDGVRAHMAQWNKPGPTPPRNLVEQLVSWADYLASRDNVYVRWRRSAP